jgi:hypothetical protein
VFAGFGDGGKFFADEGEIVVGVGILGIETNGFAEMVASWFEVFEIFENAAEIEVGEGVVWLSVDGTLEIFGRFLEISGFIVERAAIEERVESLRVE